MSEDGVNVPRSAHQVNLAETWFCCLNIRRCHVVTGLEMGDLARVCGVSYNIRIIKSTSDMVVGAKESVDTSGTGTKCETGCIGGRASKAG